MSSSNSEYMAGQQAPPAVAEQNYGQGPALLRMETQSGAMQCGEEHAGAMRIIAWRGFSSYSRLGNASHSFAQCSDALHCSPWHGFIYTHSETLHGMSLLSPPRLGIARHGFKILDEFILGLAQQAFPSRCREWQRLARLGKAWHGNISYLEIPGFPLRVGAAHGTALFGASRHGKDTSVTLLYSGTAVEVQAAPLPCPALHGVVSHSIILDAWNSVAARSPVRLGQPELCNQWLGRVFGVCT